MKTLNGVIGLLGALTIMSATVPLQAQGWPAATSEVTYGGPSEHARIEGSPWHAAAVHRPAPYAYVWEGYCGEAAMHEMRRMQHFMTRPESECSDCDGGCSTDKNANCASSGWCASPGRNATAYQHGRFVVQPRTICEDCAYSTSAGRESRDESDVENELESDEDAAPPVPPTPDSAETGAPQPVREPVYLTPVEADRDSGDQPTSTIRSHGPVIRMAPAPPTPTDIQDAPGRIPRNAIPPRG